MGYGECDAVLETDSVVVFIEFKKKGLTTRARGANVGAILADLARGLFNPHYQTGRHELALVKDGHLTLNDGATTYIVELGGPASCEPGKRRAHTAASS